MAVSKTFNIDDWRLGTGYGKGPLPDGFYDACNQLPEKTYITKPYTLKRRRRDREEQKP